MIRTYASPEAFKQALEQRLRAATRTGPALSRRRQLLVFKRFLARIARGFGEAATLKGGLVLELRLDRARATKDVDLRMMGSADGVLLRLQAAARHDLGDFLSFEVVLDDDHPVIRSEGMRYQGMRFRAEARLAGKPYGHPFGVDLAFGDPIVGEADVLLVADELEFIGIAPAALSVYPIVTHVAEKLHAYTLPRSRPNTRIKDLPDLALLATAGPLAAALLGAALERTYTFRDTHPLPFVLPVPLEAWARPYAAMARDHRLAWTTIDELTTAVRAFLDPVLAGARDRTWDPAAWAWRDVTSR